MFPCSMIMIVDGLAFTGICVLTALVKFKISDETMLTSSTGVFAKFVFRFSFRSLNCWRVSQFNLR